MAHGVGGAHGVAAAHGFRHGTSDVGGVVRISGAHRVSGASGCPQRSLVSPHPCDPHWFRHDGDVWFILSWLSLRRGAIVQQAVRVSHRVIGQMRPAKEAAKLAKWTGESNGSRRRPFAEDTNGASLTAHACPVSAASTIEVSYAGGSDLHDSIEPEGGPVSPSIRTQQTQRIRLSLELCSTRSRLGSAKVRLGSTNFGAQHY